MPEILYYSAVFARTGLIFSSRFLLVRNSQWQTVCDPDEILIANIIAQFLDYVGQDRNYCNGIRSIAKHGVVGYLPFVALFVQIKYEFVNR